MNKLIILFTLLSTITYAQPVFPIDSLAISYIPTPPPIEVAIPDFISPNGDGINDVFILVLEPNYKVEMKVYSRWGNLVYKSLDYQNDYSPTKLSDGVYAFWIRVYDGDRYKDFQKMITIIN